jgi:dUTP pyrophosphatase
VSSLKINFVKLHSDAVKPQQAKAGDAGYDLFALESVLIRPFERKLVKTGIAAQIPKGYYGRIAPRSGLAWKSGIDVLGGVIDSGYRGDIGVILINHEVSEFLSTLISTSLSDKAFKSLFGLPGEFRINKGDKIAQLIIENCHCVEWQETSRLEESTRAEGGFGSSGSRAVDDGPFYEHEKSPEST